MNVFQFFFCLLSFLLLAVVATALIEHYLPIGFVRKQTHYFRMYINDNFTLFVVFDYSSTAVNTILYSPVIFRFADENNKVLFYGTTASTVYSQMFGKLFGCV